jgi:hypothetical protein
MEQVVYELAEPVRQLTRRQGDRAARPTAASPGVGPGRWRARRGRRGIRRNTGPRPACRAS